MRKFYTMKQLLFIAAFVVAVFCNAQVPQSKIKEITKKFVMIDAKLDGDVVNIRYDSLIVKQETMRGAIMSYLAGSNLKTEEISQKYNKFKEEKGGKFSENDIPKMEEFRGRINKIIDRQKVLMFDKLDKANDTNKNIIHSRAIYYLKLDDGVTDGVYQSDYYFTSKGIPIDNIYEYFLEKIN